ncbi:hypothetical protein [Rhodopseudomonas telluris]|uniref:Uncharacterized protein n=1 Tax=Rhodopseudomonas telluris TaxID=644215 RepID=A0ABV6ELS7_9BRAD
MWYAAVALTTAMGLSAGLPATDVAQNRHGPLIRVASEVFVQQPSGFLPALRQRPADAPPLPQTPESGGPARSGAAAAAAPAPAASSVATPESGPAAASVTANAAQSGVACGPQNASSKECYSATQQYRSPAR